MTRRPLLALAVAFAGGILIASPEGPFLLAGSASACALLLSNLFTASSRRLPAFLLLVLAFGLTGAFATRFRAQSSVPEGLPLGRSLLLDGVVESISASPGRVSLTLACTAAAGPGGWAPARFRAQLGAEIPRVPWVAGETLRLEATLIPLPSLLNPGSTDPTPRLEARGVAFLGHFDPARVVPLGGASRLALGVARLRERFGAEVDAMIPDPAAAALVRALAVGDRSTLDPDTAEQFNASGLAHILSVSGLHIAVVAAGLYRILRWLLARSSRLDPHLARRTAAAAAIPTMWAYVLLTGAEVPAVRSGLMASSLFAATLLGRDGDGLTSLGLALLSCLAYDPSSLWEPSFQLSFSAVAGLLLLPRTLRALLPGRPAPPALLPAWRRALEWLLSAALTTAAASLATGPIVAAYFHRASLVSLAANLVALPVASGLTAAAAGAAAAFAVHPALAWPPLYLAGLLARLLAWLAHLFGSPSWAWVGVAAPSAVFVACYYLVLGLLATFRDRPHRARQTFALGCAALLLAGAWKAARPLFRRELEVSFLAVGQGDAELLQCPGGAALLIDAGGRPSSGFDTGARIVSPFLWEKDVRSLQAVAASHFHPDHVLGIPSVLRGFPTGALWLGEGDPEPEADRALLARLTEAAAGAGVPLRRLARGSPLESCGGVQIEVLHPRPEGDPSLSTNDSSLVLRATLGEVSFLFAGDVEVAAEEELLSGGLSPATVLKAPHHGSRTSSTPAFVRAVAPHHVVFCVGAGNRFGFPHPEVARRYEEAGCALYRTDLDGAVTFTTDGHSVRAGRFAPRR